MGVVHRGIVTLVLLTAAASASVVTPAAIAAANPRVSSLTAGGFLRWNLDALVYHLAPSTQLCMGSPDRRTMSLSADGQSEQDQGDTGRQGGIRNASADSPPGNPKAKFRSLPVPQPQTRRNRDRTE